MTSDSVYENNQQILKDQSSTDKTVQAIRRLSAAELVAYEERVFVIISENNGKFTFRDILEIVGGPTHKQILYKALASLGKQAKITRIRGIGKKRIEFFYYDTKKLKKSPTSASVRYVSS